MPQVPIRMETVSSEETVKLPAVALPRPKALTQLDDLRNPRGPLWVGGAVVLVVFFGLGTWAALTPIGSAAIAPGWIAVESSHRTIQHLEGGIVKELLVTDGSVVKAGDPLLRMDDTKAQSQLETLQADLDSSQGIEARLLAERDGKPAVTFPPELLARRAIPAVDAILASQLSLFQARRSALDGQKQILEQRIAQYKQQIVGLKALEVSKRQQAAYIRDELNGLVGLMNQGIVPKTRVLALEREAARLEGERGDHIASIARSEQGIGEAQLQILQLEKGRQEEVAKEIRDTQTKLVELKQKMIAAEDTKRRIEIIAPVSGTVMNLNYHTIGGVIGQGSAIMDIFPTDDKMIIECQINLMDIDTVHVDGDVAVHIIAGNAGATPIIHGTLESISPDRVVDQKSGASFYKGRIVITKEQKDRLGEIELHSGMQADAFISRGEQTVLSYALKPLLSSFSRTTRAK